MSNLAFAKTVLQDKSAVEKQRVLVENLRAEHRPSLPTTLALERQINPFLQTKTVEAFKTLRIAKDNF